MLQFALAQGVDFIPLRGERDEEYQFGATLPIKGWDIDAGYFHTAATNFFDHDESLFTTWLHRLTVNHVLMHFRKTRRRKDQLTEDGELPERMINGPNVRMSFPIIDRLALAEAIVKLAPGYRAVFVLHDVEGLEHLEIATILGCAVGTSKSQLHKARMKIRSLLKQRSFTSQSKTTYPVVNPNLEALSLS